jgi:hypothetical protein
MQSNGITQLYEPFPVSTLYNGRAVDILGRVLFFSCFPDGKTTSTIPNKYAALQSRDFAFGCAD